MMVPTTLEGRRAPDERVSFCMEGWVKLHRKLLENDVFMHDKTAKLLFVDLLLLVKRDGGYYDTGRFQLAEITGLKPTTLYKALIRLELTGMVTLTSNNRFTRISICNWSKYQGDGNSVSNNKVTTKGQQSNNKVTLNKKEELRIKNNTTDVVLGEAVNKSNSDINAVFNYWTQTTGMSIHSKQQANRRAAYNLFRKHGQDKLQQLIDGVALALDDQYAPRISDFCDLQAKLNELIVWGRKRGVKHGAKAIDLT